jgi:PST family polysaccharide transporter
MFTFLKNSVFGLISVGVRLFSSLVLNKVIASYFGPAGLAQMAHFQNLLAFFTLVPNDGINRGIMPYISHYESNPRAFYQYIKSGFGLTFLVFGLTTLLVLLGRKWFLIFLPSDIIWLVLFFSGAFLVVVQSFFNAVLLARKRTFIVVAGN